MVTAGHSLCVVQTNSDLHRVAFLESMGVLHRKTFNVEITITYAALLDAVTPKMEEICFCETVVTA